MSYECKSLISLIKNEGPWVICWGHSEEMSDVSESESLILLTKNERMSELLIFLSESLICSFFDKNEGFAWKANERIPTPEFFLLDPDAVGKI